MEKRRRGGSGVLCLLLCAAADAKWPAANNPGRHDGKASSPGLPPLPAPPPTAGADHLPPTQTAPHFGFPLQPTLGAAAPPTAGAGAGGEGYPFIGSNPTVPLPTGMTDTATVLPLPDTNTNPTVVGLADTVHVHLSMIGLGVAFAMAFLSAPCQLVSYIYYCLLLK